MNIAIVGGGISGLTAAHLLSRKYPVTLFEANDYIGGHTATTDVMLNGTSYAVDTGFIVYNDWTYPNFIRLLNSFGIATQPTNMGFSVTSRDGSLEYCGSSLNTLFSDRRNITDGNFLGMLGDIVRFNSKAKADLCDNLISPDLSLMDYLRQGGFGKLFIRGYIIPMASAIWSAASRTVAEFQALFFIRFFENHGLLNLFRRPRWRVIKNGSRSYIPAITRSYSDRIFCSTPVREITRADAGVRLKTDTDDLKFDAVVMASHSDQTLGMLSDATELERKILGAIPYHDNDVTLHTDTRVLPRKKRAWTSWNYCIDRDAEDMPLLTYNMNILQNLDAPETLCVTVNGNDSIEPSKVISRYSYAHPQFSKTGIQAQSQLRQINGVGNTWFCGAYWHNGFHEDGVVSGINVARSLGVEWT